MYTLYRTLTWLSGPLLPGLLRRRLEQGKEEAGRLGERLGRAAVPRPQGALLWVHAASVGESASVQPLLKAITARYPDLNILLTTVTVASARLMSKTLPERAIHQYAPVDHPSAIRRFLKHWQPDAALWVESELWPNMILQTCKLGCRMGLVNARMSQKSHDNWQKVRPLALRQLDCFDAIFPQSEDDAKRFAALGAQSLHMLGNLKYDAPPLPADPKKTGEMVAMIGSRPTWLAASTHEGEEEQIAQVHATLAIEHADLLTIIVPRHAHRGPRIAEMLRKQGFSVALRSEQQPVTETTQFYLADTMGELGIFYRIAGIVFVGGSLIEHGGQNLMEPARLDCAVICGPHMFNFDAIYHEMRVESACLGVRNATELAETVSDLLRNHDKQEALAQAALKLMQAKGGVIDKLMEHLHPMLEPLATPRKGAA